ncbi:tryptophan--tRNA ligase [Candidatus Saganbacteria bacterium]|uniref:Tryptophan--tRNA ligase n=1 Tax=Candidatus Saganbacteria bacterium TaxID=2575572 RepID=A0A9D6YW47_UNCSA|nr:tryptophan--tRNA ligase [Candidatus Saganbacteria bacterium]
MTNDKLRGRVVSGIQPTGKLHLGNLIGAVENWVKLQNNYEGYFFIADLHALTTAYAETGGLKEDIKQAALDLLSAGVDPQRCVLFKQSDVPEHAELHLMLSMITPLPWLERVPTYKSKIEELKEKDLGTYGFLGYPVLQAADILIYKGDLVPVGEDQLPHLELTREIARRFNFLYGQVFPEPQETMTKFPVLPGIDGRKMSKSAANAIAISDAPDVVRKKVNMMITDPARVKKEDKGHPGVCAIYDYYEIFAPERAEPVARQCCEAGRGCVECKKELVEILLKYLSPLHARRASFEKEPGLIERLLGRGAQTARQVASQTLREAKRVMALI